MVVIMIMAGVSMTVMPVPAMVVPRMRVRVVVHGVRISRLILRGQTSYLLGLYSARA